MTEDKLILQNLYEIIAYKDRCVKDWRDLYQEQKDIAKDYKKLLEDAMEELNKRK